MNPMVSIIPNGATGSSREVLFMGAFNFNQERTEWSVLKKNIIRNIYSKTTEAKNMAAMGNPMPCAVKDRGNIMSFAAKALFISDKQDTSILSVLYCVFCVNNNTLVAWRGSNVEAILVVCVSFRWDVLFCFVVLCCVVSSVSFRFLVMIALCHESNVQIVQSYAVCSIEE